MKISLSWGVILKVVDIRDYSSKDIGFLGERVAAHYLRRQGFLVLGTNIKAVFGELDIVATKKNCLHVVEVKSLKCRDFPSLQTLDYYDPRENLHQNKIRKVTRMASWYVDSVCWEGEWQVDGALIWLRERDGMARVRYYPQIL